MATLAKLVQVDVSAVKGLGGKRSESLRKAGIGSVSDLLHHVPRRYIDRSRRSPISKVPIDQEVTILGEVVSVKDRRPRRNLHIIEAVIKDESAQMKAVWFNQSFRVRQLQSATEVALSGKVEAFRGSLQMKSPEVDVLANQTEGLTVGRVVPVHSTVGGVGPGYLRRAIHNAIGRSLPMPDPVPTELLAANGLMDRGAAFETIHFPEEVEQAAPARKRLVYDELFRLELALAMQKRHQMETSQGIVHKFDGELVSRFVAGLPYELTRAQRKVLEEIESDLGTRYPMHRLLQGEVGSGKTVVAVATLLRGVEGGWQGALMAPTEVLAEQHYLGVRSLLADASLSPGLGSHLGMESLFDGGGPAVHVGLLTGSTAVANYDAEITRQQLADDIASGQVDLVVGTHALIQEGVEFSRLGVAVIDEQHRFGVAQRVLLKEKAGEAEPDVLIMTATPIPRTLSMTLYGDLDVSIIDEMPPGRTPVATKALSKLDEAKAWEVVSHQVEKGRQAFVVCPLVDDSPKVEAASATAEFERLSALMSDLRVGLIHGQMRSADKEAVMAAYRSGEIDVLVATTVIEVGIDVPNATVMVIEDAQRFGLSQLHQLRGRVGRGKHPGRCILLADPTTTEGEDRIAAMVATTDGFRLAEEDLRIRGQGTVFGTRQSGVKDLKITDILSDFDILVGARRDAFAMVDSDPGLEEHRDLRDEVLAFHGSEVDWLFVS